MGCCCSSHVDPGQVHADLSAVPGYGKDSGFTFEFLGAEHEHEATELMARSFAGKPTGTREPVLSWLIGGGDKLSEDALTR